VMDCAHTLFSSFGGRPVWRWGAASFFSYEWGKPVIAGLGGSVVANDPELGARLDGDYARLGEPPLSRGLKVLVQYAGFRAVYHPLLYWPVRSAFRFLSRTGVAVGNFNPVGEPVSPEFGWRMARPQREILRWQLGGAERAGAHARRIAAEYDRRIAAAVLRPSRPAAAECTLTRYPLLVEGKAELADRARARRLELAQWYETPIHPLRGAELAVVGYREGSCPNAERNARRIVSLPLNPKVGERDVRVAAELLGGA
jgi:perosamine synthetase